VWKTEPSRACSTRGHAIHGHGVNDSESGRTYRASAGHLLAQVAGAVLFGGFATVGVLDDTIPAGLVAVLAAFAAGFVGLAGWVRACSITFGPGEQLRAGLRSRSWGGAVDLARLVAVEVQPDRPLGARTGRARIVLHDADGGRLVLTPLGLAAYAGPEVDELWSTIAARLDRGTAASPNARAVVSALADHGEPSPAVAQATAPMIGVGGAAALLVGSVALVAYLVAGTPFAASPAADDGPAGTPPVPTGACEDVEELLARPAPSVATDDAVLVPEAVAGFAVHGTWERDLVQTAAGRHDPASAELLHEHGFVASWITELSDGQARPLVHEVVRLRDASATAAFHQHANRYACRFADLAAPSDGVAVDAIRLRVRSQRAGHVEQVSWTRGADRHLLSLHGADASEADLVADVGATLVPLGPPH
jgi:hypothetical protein